MVTVVMAETAETVATAEMVATVVPEELVVLADLEALEDLVEDLVEVGVELAVPVAREDLEDLVALVALVVHGEDLVALEVPVAQEDGAALVVLVVLAAEESPEVLEVPLLSQLYTMALLPLLSCPAESGVWLHRLRSPSLSRHSELLLNLLSGFRLRFDLLLTIL
jgi:hypothetical protein